MARVKNAHKTKDKQVVVKPEFKNVLPFEPTLAYAFRSIGGKESAIGGARLLAERDQRFLRVVTAFDSLSDSDKGTVRIEDLCAGAELTPGEFLGEVTKALWERNADIGRLIAAVNHPRVIESTIEHSASPFGGQDRKMLLEASGFLPTKQGLSINIDNSKKTLNAGAGTTTIEQVGLPSFEENGTELMTAIRGDHTKALPPPSIKQIVEVPSGEVLDAEIVQPEDN
jgi:hypothetical protein